MAFEKPEKNMNILEDQIEKAVEWMAEDRNVALATVIATWGSSPRPVGSQLVVDERGSFEGSVSGGCIESTIVTEAGHVIKEGKPQRLSIGISNKQAWETGLACGGNIEIFIETAVPWRSDLELLIKLRKEKKMVCLLTNLETGDKRMIDANDPQSISTLAPQLQAAIAQVNASGDSLLLTVDGEAFFIHGFTPNPQLIIFGAVHIAQPLARIARLVGFDVLIIDPRLAFATTERFPETRLITLRPEKVFDQLALHPNTAVVALSHSPMIDDPALIHALKSDVFYIGALGSKKTHSRRLERLKNAGLSDKQLQRIHAPVGLSIGSKTPAEIALAIMAQIVNVRHAVG
jgi:xanthine dehydrogenase accessory factor